MTSKPPILGYQSESDSDSEVLSGPILPARLLFLLWLFAIVVWVAVGFLG